MAAQVPADMLFGPAYKGIPLVATTAIALADEFGVDMPYAFNRKEAKTHGEGGSIVGSALTGNVVIVDDVITAGTAIKESLAILNNAGARGTAGLIGLDRCERGDTSLSAVQQVEQENGISVISVISLHDIIEWVENNPEMSADRDALERYREQYGVA
jgi:orotate phosphoribosyltransferase